MRFFQIGTKTVTLGLGPKNQFRATWAQKQDISNHKSGSMALISRPHFLLESEDESNKIMKSQKKKFYLEPWGPGPRNYIWATSAQKTSGYSLEPYSFNFHKQELILSRFIRTRSKMLDIILTFHETQKSHFIELFEYKVKQGYEIWCTYYLRLGRFLE